MQAKILFVVNLLCMALCSMAAENDVVYRLGVDSAFIPENNTLYENKGSLFVLYDREKRLNKDAYRYHSQSRDEHTGTETIVFKARSVEPCVRGHVLLEAPRIIVTLRQNRKQLYNVPKISYQVQDARRVTETGLTALAVGFLVISYGHGWLRQYCGE